MNMKTSSYQSGARDAFLGSSFSKQRKYEENVKGRMGMGSKSMVLLVGLTASLLILPLILPPLPPPPLMLLLLPIFILGVLMILAFMPSNARANVILASSHMQS